VRWCLEKDPARRIQTGADLARFLSHSPELRSELPPRLADFMKTLRLGSDLFSGALLVVGLPALIVLGNPLDQSDGPRALKALGALVLMLTFPGVMVLPATRRLRRRGYERADMVHALEWELDRQRRRPKRNRGSGSTDPGLPAVPDECPDGGLGSWGRDGVPAVVGGAAGPRRLNLGNQFSHSAPRTPPSLEHPGLVLDASNRFDASATSTRWS
jgi:hypothetical protein